MLGPQRAADAEDRRRYGECRVLASDPAGITYIRLRLEFVYVAVLSDAFSRWVIGWALGRTLEAELTFSGLRPALRQRKPPPGLAHHFDRGRQYASKDYTDLLKEHNIRDQHGPHRQPVRQVGRPILPFQND